MYLSFLPSLLLSVSAVLLSGNKFDPEIGVTNGQYAGILVGVAGGIWSLLVYPGYLYLQAKAARGETPDPGECFKKGLSRLFPLLGMSLLGGVLVVLGFIAFIIPGVMLVRGFFLAPYYVMDQDLGPVDALKKSYQDSKPVSAWIWGIVGVEIVIGSLGYVFGFVPSIGYLLSLAIGYIYAFGPALRYVEVAGPLNSPVQEVAAAQATIPRPRKNGTRKKSAARRRKRSS